MAIDDRRERELVLAPNEYAYVLDTTKGHINCYVGPNKTSLAQTDQPVVFDAPSGRFRHADLKDAVSLFATAPAHGYVVLENPARDGAHPHPGVANSLVDLQVGRKTIVPGPASFALWPGQTAQVIEGHRLRADQYLVVQVYDVEAAHARWREALGRPDAPDDDRPRFVTGQLLVIRGDAVRFYIPPTGVEVVPEAGGRFVRDAVTLHRLAWCALLGEDGGRRYVRGEAVVFPSPTERFETVDGQRAFPAIELSDTTGLHVKVVAPYTDDAGEHAVGEELFLTGDGRIYFPHEAHQIVRQGGRTVHQAVAVPRGEGRYVLDRHTGEVRLVSGPVMLLPDPRREVVVRRVLSDRECQLLYPGNADALAHNRALRGEGPSRPRPRAEAPATDAEGWTGPRTLTLDNRFEGAVRVEVWSGHAVQVVDRAGGRRVVRGPASVLLGYDETLAALALSTGTPKSDATRLRTAYLQVTGNKVSDRVELVTADLVRVALTLTYRVSFEGTEPERWFAVDDYVRLLCDHAGSILKARVRQVDVRALQGAVAPLVRDVLLGAKDDDGRRPGRVFAENGMRVHDVEVLELAVLDPRVQALLDEAQAQAMARAVQVAAREAELDGRRRLEGVDRALAAARHETLTLQTRLEAERAEAAHTEALVSAARQAQLAEHAAARRQADAEVSAALGARRRAEVEANHAVDLARRRDLQALALAALDARVKGAAEVAGALDPHLVPALRRLGDQQLLSSLAEHFGELAAVEGRGLLETARRFLDFVPQSLVPSLRAEEPSA